jgi:hypothetical protein
MNFNQLKIFAFLFALLLNSFAVQSAFSQYIYNPEGKPDPFMPEESEFKNGNGNKEFKNFEATQVTLLGTVMGTEPTALVQLPGDNNSVVLKIGSRLGNNAGRVISITKDNITIREVYAGVGNGNKGGKSFRDTVVKFNYDVKQAKISSDASSNQLRDARHKKATGNETAPRNEPANFLE